MQRPCDEKELACWRNWKRKPIGWSWDNGGRWWEIRLRILADGWSLGFWGAMVKVWIWFLYEGKPRRALVGMLCNVLYTLWVSLCLVSGEQSFGQQEWKPGDPSKVNHSFPGDDTIGQGQGHSNGLGKKWLEFKSIWTRLIYLLNVKSNTAG